MLSEERQKTEEKLAEAVQKERDKSQQEIDRVIEEERKKAQQLLEEEQVGVVVFLNFVKIILIKFKLFVYALRSGST